MKDLGGTLKVPQSSTKILNFGPEFVKLLTLKAKKKKNSPKITPNFTLPYKIHSSKRNLLTFDYEEEQRIHYYRTEN
jgi:hypothetical protein